MRDPFPACSGKNSRHSHRISRGGALQRKGERNSTVVPHSQSPPDVSVHSRETCFPCTASTFKPRIDSHLGGTWVYEELLDHLLKSGYRKIGVTVKGRKMRVIEIRAEGEDSPWRKRTPNWPKSVGNYIVSLPFRGFDPGLSSHHSYHLDKNDEND